MALFILWLAIIAVASYFLGCFNGSVIVSKYILKDDIRTHGSGNAGLTNFYRTFGGPLTAVVILCDVLKMVLSVLIGVFMIRHLPEAALLWLKGQPWLTANLLAFSKYFTGLFCVLGHMFPCMFHFKGGKGVLSGGALALMIDWRVALVAWGGFLLLAAITKWISLGSCWAGFSFPFSTWFVFHDPVLVVLAICSGWLLVWKHRANLKRILSGTESKFSFHPKR